MTDGEKALFDELVDGISVHSAKGIQATRAGVYTPEFDSAKTWSHHECPVFGYSPITPITPITPPQYRMLRVLEYVGSREFIDSHIKQRVIKGSPPSGWNGGEGVIIEGLIGELPPQITPKGESHNG